MPATAASHRVRESAAAVALISDQLAALADWVEQHPDQPMTPEVARDAGRLARALAHHAVVIESLRH